MKRYICDLCGQSHRHEPLFCLQSAFKSKGGILIPEEEKHFCDKKCFDIWVSKSVGIIPIKYTRRWPGKEDFGCPHCGQPYMDDDERQDNNYLVFSCHNCLRIFRVLRTMRVQCKAIR
jgi:hypothetical protein